MTAPRLKTSTAAILGDPDLRVLFGMKPIGELLERGVEEFRGEYCRRGKCHQGPPDGRRPYPEQRDKGRSHGERVRAEAALGAQGVRNTGKGKTQSLQEWPVLHLRPRAPASRTESIVPVATWPPRRVCARQAMWSRRR
jgi:hypothetical protein